jgi:hypothetical protein
MCGDCSPWNMIKKVICCIYEFRYVIPDATQNTDKLSNDLIKLNSSGNNLNKLGKSRDQSFFIFKHGDEEIKFEDYNKAINHRESLCVNGYRKRRCVHCLIMTLLIMAILIGIILLTTICPIEQKIRDAFNDCSTSNVDQYCRDCQSGMFSCECPTRQYSLCVCSADADSECGRGCLAGLMMIIFGSILLFLKMICCLQLVCQDEKLYNKKKYDIIGIS